MKSYLLSALTASLLAAAISAAVVNTLMDKYLAQYSQINVNAAQQANAALDARADELAHFLPPVFKLLGRPLGECVRGAIHVGVVALVKA